MISGFKMFMLRSESLPNRRDSEAVAEALRGRRERQQSDSSPNCASFCKGSKPHYQTAPSSLESTLKTSLTDRGVYRKGGL